MTHISYWKVPYSGVSMIDREMTPKETVVSFHHELILKFAQAGYLATYQVGFQGVVRRLFT